MTLPRTVLYLTVLCLALSGCRPGSREPATPAGETAGSGETVYRVRGVVRKVKDAGRVAVIDHEEIPGYMEAMVMPFHARDGSVFSAVKPGDRIEFDYVVGAAGAWVEKVAVLAESP